MTNKEAFITIFNEMLKSSGMDGGYAEGSIMEKAMTFFNEEIVLEKKEKPITEKGVKILSFMAKGMEDYGNKFTAKVIGESMGVNGKSISGSMLKLVKDGFCEKTGKNPVVYSLTEKGKAYNY